MFGDTANFLGTNQPAPGTLRICKIPHKLICHIDPMPSDRMSEYGNGRGYGTSRQPLRKAFVKLAERSRITLRSRLGALILRIVWSTMLDARFLREAFEADLGGCWWMRPMRRS